MKRKLQVISVLGVVAFLVLLAYFQVRPPSRMAEPIFDYMGDVTIQGPLVYEPVWNECTQDWRPMYYAACHEQQARFGNLPKAPKDLADISELFFYSKIGMRRLITQHPDTQAAQYWLQPEFYPGWSESYIEKKYGTHGYGFYPGGVQLTVPREWTGNLEIFTLLYTSFSMKTWQGFHLFPLFMDTAIRQDGSPVLDPAGNPLMQDPKAVPFTVQIEAPSDALYRELVAKGTIEEERRPGGQFFVLPPTMDAFGSGWTILLRLRIQFTEPLEQGVWFFALDMDNGSWRLNQEYYLVHGPLYVESGEWLVTRKTPAFQGFIVVV